MNEEYLLGSIPYIKVIVWFDSGYKVSKTIYVPNHYSKKRITAEVIKQFGLEWFSYDIWD